VAPRRKHRVQEALLPWLFLSPAVLLFLFIVVVPTVGTLGLSFFKWDGLGPAVFVGFRNFAQLAVDPVFYQALSNNLRWLSYFCTIPIAVGLVHAYLISKVGRLQIVYRTVIFLPYVCSTVVTAMIWKWIYDPFFGLNPSLASLGIRGLPNWLGSPKIALYAVALTDSWRYCGFLMVLFLTALTQTDKQLEEAALLDGAGRWRIFRSIVLPQLRPTMVLILMLTMIWSFAAFDYVYVMTTGGPGRATELLATYMYSTTIKGQAAGYASTISFTMLLLSVIVMVGFAFLRRRGWEV